MSSCTHSWQGRPDQSTEETQRYKCDLCGSWGWRKFKPVLTAIKAYKDGRSFDGYEVNSWPERGAHSSPIEDDERQELNFDMDQRGRRGRHSSSKSR